jgi:hypothetical protein
LIKRLNKDRPIEAEDSDVDVVAVAEVAVVSEEVNAVYEEARLAVVLPVAAKNLNLLLGYQSLSSVVWSRDA